MNLWDIVMLITVISISGLLLSFYSRMNMFLILGLQFANVWQSKSTKEGYKYLKGYYFFMGSLFFKLLVINLWGLFPFIKSLASGINLVQFLSLWGWGSIFISSMVFSLGMFVSSFMPSSPFFIMPFLSCIEVVSYFIRPLTLSLRLSINLTTGHILLWLLGNVVFFLFQSKKMFFFAVLLFSWVMFFYESCMGFIQALVFALLLKSYFGEHAF